MRRRIAGAWSKIQSLPGNWQVTGRGPPGLSRLPFSSTFSDMALPKIGKIFLWLAGSAVVLVGLTVLVITLMLGRIVKSGVNTFGPQITGTAVELAAAEVSLFSGTATLSGLRIGNPVGWGEGDLATLGKIHLDLDPWSLLGETIVIEDLDIEDPVFSYEMQGGTSNVEVLLGAVNRALGSRPEQNGGTPPPDAPPDAAAPPTLIAVGHFGLRGANVRVVAAGRTIDATMPDIDMVNLGTPAQGLTPSALTLQVSRRVLTEIATAAAKAAVQNKLEEAVGGRIRDLFGRGN